MAEDRHRQDYPQQNRHEESKSQPPPHYHHPTSRDGPPSETEAPPHSRPNMAASVTLPSIHDARPGSYGAPPPAARGYANDPRYASPNSVNGYPPPSGGQQQPPPPPPQQQGTYLPPLQPQADPRSSAYAPPEQQRGGYYDDRRPQGYHDQYQSDYYYRGPPQGPPGSAYPHDYRGPPGAYGQEYGQPGGERPREAPRQRTSIACRYCRKRKIRCSGHQNAPGGKCQNCARMNQECIFQPVSSSSSTAFIPVSAVPGGVPPGTQLFGAYGQPLAPSTVAPHPQHPYPPAGGPPHPPPPANYYHQPVQSPTESYSSYGDPRGEEQVTGRRRRRTPEEQEEGYRLPPPRTTGVPEEDPRRRSPAEFSNNSSPGGLNYSRYPGPPARHSPRNPTLPPPAAVSGSDNRSPIAQNGSSGTSTPARPGPPTNPPPASTASSVMSLSNLVEKNDIDKGMIDRLNRPRDPNASQNGGLREGSR